MALHKTSLQALLSGPSVSSEYARDPQQTPAQIAKNLYGNGSLKVDDSDEESKNKPDDDGHTKLEKEIADLSARIDPSALDLTRFGPTPPSPLFLRIYASILASITSPEGPGILSGMTSPSLLACSGVTPLAIITPLADIVKHMANVIVRAKKEVFLATNFWINSDSSHLITDAIHELNRRVASRGGPKVIVKVLYDRGNPKQLITNHQPVPPSTYTGDKVALPAPESIPNLHMQVLNYHVPLVGTFHSKFLVVDREVALLMSNNIQDNDNVEMCVQYEGSVVDSLYDVCLNSWAVELDPPLPCREEPAAQKGFPSYDDPTFMALFGNDATKESISLQQVVEAGHQARDQLTEGTQGTKEDLPELLPGEPHYDPTIAGEIRRIQAAYAPKANETHLQAVSRHFNITKVQKADGGVQPTAPEPKDGSLVNETEMTPYIPLPPSAFPPFSSAQPTSGPTPIPMCVVSRAPYGTPLFEASKAIRYPQNVAFMLSIMHATESVFIQTPNLNAAPLLPALVAAVRRGVTVEMWVCLGYNDAGELLPYQNGTNEMIANRLYNDPSLHPEGAAPLTPEEKSRLKIYNYIAKDQDRPIHNKFKKRSCHVKLLIVDNHLAIQGNGNQDTQTWFHSQEVNVMLDSKEVCARWMEGIRRNQNTEIYGRVSTEDGCWHDPTTGAMPEGSIGTDPGRFSWATGIVGAVQRVRGAGGF
ncbi:hypothetical protein BDP27DRAFT_1325900 [Rhodocollybia butyracea]|uniref:PLD phosphodiesterase domain-containing protein n=1 Tax=Rhodocollybia butyracea TaxID=206335 RepID=A0A9P5PTS6_9AGAR|nr:hypothetical protein BDP27DRAFT_1325900 [Rhodocollybia butyracea]